MFKLLLLSILIVNAFTKESYKCDIEGKYICSKTQTCCKNMNNLTGYACFPLIDGVCCDDNITCCPKDSICNTTYKSCDNVSFLTFLDDNNPLNQPNLNDIKMVLEFSNGFFVGLQVFSNLPHKDSCIVEDKNITNDILEIVTLINSIEAKNILENAEKIAAKVYDIYNEINNISPICSEFSKEIKMTFDNIMT